MDHLAQDLTVALEESESCGPITVEGGIKWGMRRRTRSAGNLRMFLKKRRILTNCRCHVPDIYCKSGDNQSDDSSSSNSETKAPERNSARRLASFHQSDSDDMSLGLVVARAMGNRNSLRMKPPFQTFLKGRYNRLGIYIWSYDPKRFVKSDYELSMKGVLIFSFFLVINFILFLSRFKALWWKL